MIRIACWTFGFLFLLSAALEVRGDILVSSVDPVTFQPSGIKRYDEWTGTPLPVGDVPAVSIPLGDFAVPLFPSSMATTSDGRLFVADSSGLVLQFDAATSAPLPHPSAPLPAGVFATTQTEQPQFGFPALTIGPDSMLYVIDGDDVSGEGGKPGVRIFDPDTGAPTDTLLESATVEFGRLTGMAFDTAGDLLIADYDLGTIFKVDVENDSIAPFITTGPNGAIGPAGILVDDSGAIYVSNADGGTIVKYDPDGTNPSVFGTAPPAAMESISSPSNMTFNRAGDAILLATLGFGGATSGQVLSFDFMASPPATFVDGIQAASAVIVVPDLLPGDFNGDGTVDNADYLKWKDDFGSEVIPTSGADGNGNGLVDIADYTIWRNTLGSTGLLPDNASLVANVPEPAAIWVAGLALLGTACWYRQRGCC
ncbi:hypothetical protein NG895_03845 [Aeoliella sp. ICT_H6.2]|uniref:PEP-CTERM protein-sorting domain-containing protein n=1 Tax=Aeoliella straminimaris TaxID=2954799 RepID=A0A9X2F734_9BACT|nr:hypothetical protein [Aeoliella straminimaris]MCO6043029.1 hypothetical protein [Aeoliella straminimaris]